MVELGDRDTSGLKGVSGVSGDMPVFHERLRDALVWAAHYYVAPVSVLLERAAPPNLPTLPDTKVDSVAPVAPPKPHPLDPVIAAAAEGRRQPPAVLLASWEDMSWLHSTARLLGDERSVLVVVATSAEAQMVGEHARRLVGDRTLDVSGELDDAGVTARWSEAASEPGRLLIGTPRVAAWPVAGLAAAVVLEEGRRAMKDRQTPTVAVPRLLMTRARLEGFSQIYVGPTPSVELLSAGPEILRRSTRAWPLVEVVDRNDEPPGSGLISRRVRAAVSGMLERSGRVFVFTHRRGYAPAYRCVKCRELRRCPTCGSRPEPGEACARCGSPSRPCLNCGGNSFEPLGAGVGRVLQEMRRMFGDRVGQDGEAAPVTVGTEADLATVEGVDLAVAVDVDGLAYGTDYRAGEEALRILARLAGRVRRGPGHRLIVQTSMPDQPLITALRRGDPVGFLSREMDLRGEMGYPPVTELMVVELRGGGDVAERDLSELADETTTVMGPSRQGDSRRWLVQGASLGAFKLALRPLVRRWREIGATVRIDVDPLDL